MYVENKLQSEEKAQSTGCTQKGASTYRLTQLSGTPKVLGVHRHTCMQNTHTYKIRSQSLKRGFGFKM